MARIDNVLITHGHLDHSGGAHHWRSRGASIWASQRTAEFLEAGDEEAIHLPAARREGIYPPDFRFQPCPVDRRLAAGETIEAGDLRLEVIAAPGHAADMVCYAAARPGQESLPMLFSADAFFYGGRIAFAPANADASRADYERTLRRLLADVPFDACYPGHGIWSARGGRRHLERAVASFDQGWMPPNLD